MQICTLSVLELTLTLFFLDEVLVSYLNTVILSDVYSQFCSFCILDLEYIPPKVHLLPKLSKVQFKIFPSVLLSNSSVPTHRYCGVIYIIDHYIYNHTYI